MHDITDVDKNGLVRGTIAFPEEIEKGRPRVGLTIYKYRKLKRLGIPIFRTSQESLL